VSEKKDGTAWKYDVFLSYCGEDVESARRLAEHIREATGLRPYFDKWEIQPGERFQRRLEEGLEKSRITLVLVGPSGVGGVQREEVDVAVSLQTSDPRRRVVPVLLPGANEVGMPRFLAQRSWIDLRRGLGSIGDGRLAKAIQPRSEEQLDRGRRSDGKNVTASGGWLGRFLRGLVWREKLVRQRDSRNVATPGRVILSPRSAILWELGGSLLVVCLTGGVVAPWTLAKLNERRYQIRDQQLLESGSMDGVLFPEEKAGPLLLYREVYNCLEFTGWREVDSATGEWERMEGSRALLALTKRVHLVDPRDCSATSELEVPRAWAVSPHGKWMAWTGEATDWDSRSESVLYTQNTQMDEGWSSRMGSLSNTGVSSMRLQFKVTGLQFVSKSLLALFFEGDKMYLLDCNNEGLQGPFYIARDASEVVLNGGILTSASPNMGLVGAYRVDDGRWSTITLLPLLDLVRDSSDLRRISGLGVSPENTIAIGTSGGSFALARVWGDRLKMLTTERAIPGLSNAISVVHWFDGNSVAFGGKGILEVLHMDFAGSGLDLEQAKYYSIPLRGAPAWLEWLRQDEAGQRIVFSGASGVNVGRLRSRCWDRGLVLVVDLSFLCGVGLLLLLLSFRGRKVLLARFS